MEERENRTTVRRRAGILLATALAVGSALSMTAGAPAQDLQTKIDQNRQTLEQKQQALQQTKQQEGVLTTRIDRLSDQVDQLSGEVATLENREALVQAQLERTEARLKRAEQRLDQLRHRLQRSLQILRQRLVAIYKSNSPDALSVILNSDGFSDLLDRYQYLNSVQQQDSELVNSVRDLRNRAHTTVNTVRDARDAIEAKKEELARTRMQLEARQADLADAQDAKQSALDETQQHEEQLEGDVSDLQGQIQAQLQAQAEAAAAATAAPTAGPTPGGTSTGPVSSSGFIWPVNGPITSPFCEQRAWESCHPGIDIGVPSGTPVHAVADGTVAIAAPEGGYGNYICIDHGGGLSSCYAHLMSFNVSVGQHVSQGQVIAISDCTGLCFGPHLHFEVRVNGSVVDPMGYL
jgi:murein DD-endopeptidase MepM/ murein hydrolase activator NlpD